MTMMMMVMMMVIMMMMMVMMMMMMIVMMVFPLTQAKMISLFCIFCYVLYTDCSSMSGNENTRKKIYRYLRITWRQPVKQILQSLLDLIAIDFILRDEDKNYHFGPEFRPVPLDQTFVGITEKQKVRRNDMMNQNDTFQILG